MYMYAEKKIRESINLLEWMHSKQCTRSRDGAVVRAFASHQTGPGSNPESSIISGLNLSLVVVLL